MRLLPEKFPRILKEPTGLILLVMVAGFLYVQWPSRVKPVEEPSYVWQTLDSGFRIAWEESPVLQNDSAPEVWGLTRKGMSFLVQSDQLNGAFTELVARIAEQDRLAVGGAVQAPLQWQESYASYAFFDAESRVQEHRWYLQGDRWIKVSVLYKPSSETRQQRAEAFLHSAGFADRTSAP
ncbi:hypothetical protein [Reinekea marinisedimentorum]|uniref:Uncharacterized protein n=1 Tax=Reinekea marinisedimentorum TaxID=230495 RepID=A0A4R3IBG9_9GAMM|nr:hypothetical protein [Reinekea marinisedimentorum]TCS43811.1 hypothetical protein BCF53_101154 [Reinekea marinisedimentorum]